MNAPTFGRRCGRIGFLVLATTWPLFLSAADTSVQARKPAVVTEKYPLENYLTEIAQGQWRAREAQLAEIKTPADVAARAAWVRAEFLKALGGLPEKKTPLNARITGVLERDGYRVEKLVFESQPGFFVTANVYVPSQGKGPFPAILGAQGHSTEGKAYPVYQLAYIALAQRGHIVLAFDPPGQGERFEKREPDGSMKLLGHFSPGLQCVLTGGNIVRYFMWDGIRAVDYLLTRPDVDPKRIGAAGNSGGGTQSAFLAVLEPRITVAAPSSYWTSWPALWAKSGPQDSEQVLHQTIKNGIDYSDVLIAFAPKPMIMLTATKDSFPIAGAHATHEEGKPIYRIMGAPDHLRFFEYNDNHGWTQPRREATYEWFDHWFYGRSGPVQEPANLKTDSVETLQSTSTGQVVTALRGKTMQVMSLETAERLYARRTLARSKDAESARTTIAARLEIGRKRNSPTITPESKTTSKYVEETVSISPEKNIALKTRIISAAATAPGPRPAVIVLEETTAPATPDRDRELAAWTSAGYTVVVAPLRGLLPPDKPADFAYTMRYRTAMRAITIGQTMPGMRVRDLLAVYDYVIQRPDVNARDISVLGRGTMGLIALYATALEPGIRRVVADRAPLSFRDLARAPAIPSLYAEVILPGVFLDFDLPDVARVAGKDKIILVNPQSLADPASAVMSARTEYGAYAKVISNDTGIVTPQELE